MRRVQTVFLGSIALTFTLLLARVSHSNDVGTHAAEIGPVQMRGKEVFEKRCTGCHALDQSREGPKLRGVYGRTSGDAAGFIYSPALAKARIVWDDASLERWLADPDVMVPGNNMEFQLRKPQERMEVIQYLKQLSAK